MWIDCGRPRKESKNIDAGNGKWKAQVSTRFRGHTSEEDWEPERWVKPIYYESLKSPFCTWREARQNHYLIKSGMVLHERSIGYLCEVCRWITWLLSKAITR